MLDAILNSIKKEEEKGRKIKKVTEINLEVGELTFINVEQLKFAFEVIYNKETPFLKLAKKNTLTCKDGADMLLYQGVIAFNLFFNKTLDENKITKYMKKAF